MTTRCMVDEELTRFVDGTLAPEDFDRARAHLDGCQRCRENETTLRAIVRDLRAPFAVDLDVHAHARSVMSRLDRPGPERVGQGRAWRWALGSSMVAATLSLAVYLGTGKSTDSWRARGGEAIAATLGRDVGLQLYAAETALRPLASGAVIERATPLTAGFRNLGSASAYLLLFAVDERRTIHWISPAVVRAGDDPFSTALPTTASERVLETTAVLDEVSPGDRLRIVSVITTTARRASEVEALEGSDLSPNELMRRFPGAELRETMVLVRDGKGAP